MPQEKFWKLEKIIMYMVIMAMPFTCLPKGVQVIAMGSVLSNLLIGIGLLVMMVEYYYYRFVVDRRFKYFIILFLGWQIISLAVGIIGYEYNECLTLNQFDKLQKILAFLSAKGIVLDELIMIKCWLFLRFSKDILLNSMSFAYVGLLVYHLYGKNFQRGFEDIRKGCLTLMCFMGCFSIFELAWLKCGFAWAEAILKALNPMFLDIDGSHGWWPPILSISGVRSLCSEPSFFGILCAFILPFIWSYVFERRHTVFISLLLCYVNLMIASTNSRTAVAITLAQIILLLLYAILVHQKKYVVPVLLICVVSMMGYGLNLVDWKSYTDKIFPAQTIAMESGKYYQIKTAAEFVDKNISTLGSVQARSNTQRVGSWGAYFNVALEHPIVGTGRGMHTAYVDANIPDFAKDNHEIKRWHKLIQEQGVFKSFYPELNKFAGVAAQAGLVGLGIYLIPWLYVLKMIFCLPRKMLEDLRINMLLIALLGLIASQFSSPDMIYCSGIVIALILCAVNQYLNKSSNSI